MRPNNELKPGLDVLQKILGYFTFTTFLCFNRSLRLVFFSTRIGLIAGSYPIFIFGTQSSFSRSSKWAGWPDLKCFLHIRPFLKKFASFSLF
jgi:hypothetical protein